jgi:ubiquinone biosynthesis protein COQ9
MSSKAEKADLRQRILLATLPNVAFDGWTRGAVRAGLKGEGLVPDTFETVFPGGMAELAAYFSSQADQAMAEEMAGLDLAEQSFEQRIGRAIIARIGFVEPHREAVRRLLAYLALSGNATLAAKSLARTADAMCHAAGDGSTDFNYYTRRAMVVGMQAATMLYWLADPPGDLAETVDFVERRFRRLAAAGRTRREIGRRLGLLPSPSRLFRVLSARAR